LKIRQKINRSVKSIKEKNMTNKITLKEFLNGVIPSNETELAEISDRLWEMGTLDDIKEKVSSDLFVFHVSINMIGNWQGDGWSYIIGDQPELIPYIPLALEALNLQDLKTVFEQTISIFPEFVKFKDDSAYCDAINFLKNVCFKIRDERLLKYSEEERTRLVEKYHNCLEELENLTVPLWGYGAERDAWEAVLDYTRKKV